jgi:hypothetical protein
MGITVNSAHPTKQPAQANPALDYLAIAKANHAVYLALTGNKFSVEIGEVTCFAHDQRKVIIGDKQLTEWGLNSADEVHYVILHELGHLKELRDDPTGFLKVLEFCKSDPDGDTIFFLYNAVMDIYVNRNAANKAGVFTGANGEYSDLVKNFYVAKAWSEHDLRDKPLCHQYAAYLLLTGMGVARAYTVSDQIQKIFDEGIAFSGRQWTYEEFITTFLIPTVSSDPTNRWRASISQRDVLIQSCLLPIFRELLEQDKQNLASLPQQGFNGQSGTGSIRIEIECGDGSESQTNNQQGKSGESKQKQDGESQNGNEDPSNIILRPGKSDQTSPHHQLTLDELEKLLEEIQKAAKEESQSAQELSDQDLHRQATDIAKAVKAQDPNDFADRLVRVQPIVNKLVDEFLKIRVPSEVKSQKLTKYSTQGDLHTPEAIRKFGKIQRDPDNAEVMREEQINRSIKRAPVNIRLCLLPDVSGSMSFCIDSLRDNVIALAAAVATLCSIHKQKQTGIVSELAIYGFDDTLHEILDPLPDASLTHVAASYNRIQAGGGTCEHLALEHLRDTLASVFLKELKENKKTLGRKTVNIAISLTDGDTARKDKSTQARLDLEKMGVECFGVFLKSSGSSGATFREIWGERGYEIDQIEELPNIIADIKSRIMTSQRLSGR